MTPLLAGAPAEDLTYGGFDLLFTIFAAGYLIYYLLLCLAVIVLAVVVLWRLLARAGFHGFVALIPIYNAFCLYKAIYGKGWYLLIALIPIVNLIFALVTPFFMARAYGRNTFFFGLALLFFPFVFELVLAFGEDTYCGPNY